MYVFFEYFKSSIFDTDHYIEHYKDEITWEKEAKEFEENIKNVCTKFDDLKRIFNA